VGHIVHLDNTPVQIVGVARNSKHFMLTEKDEAAFYEPYFRAERRTDLHFLIRPTGRPEPLLPAITATLAEVDASAAIETKPMSRALTFALLPSRFGAAVLGSMGVLGLLLASIGFYGVLLYSVSRRTREIGLRVALGATPRSVLKMVMGHSAALLGAGLGAGMTLAFFAVQPLAMFLIPGVRPADPLNFLVVGTVLSLVAVAATAAPAIRALRVDPMVALRHE
jgi:ABC-type antimicrobial peptide transport system permease subunit